MTDKIMFNVTKITVECVVKGVVVQGHIRPPNEIRKFDVPSCSNFNNLILVEFPISLLPIGVRRKLKNKGWDVIICDDKKRVLTTIEVGGGLGGALGTLGVLYSMVA